MAGSPPTRCEVSRRDLNQFPVCLLPSLPSAILQPIQLYQLSQQGSTPIDRDRVAVEWPDTETREELEARITSPGLISGQASRERG
jgi:hypothetical protein